jgi:hypothetical protein
LKTSIIYKNVSDGVANLVTLEATTGNAIASVNNSIMRKFLVAEATRVLCAD